MSRYEQNDRPGVSRETIHGPDSQGSCLRVIAVPAMGVALLALRWWR